MIIRTGAFYQAFKYSIYAALTINTVYFFIENFAGAAYTYRDGLALTDIIVAYTDAIDTAAWLVLLLLLELETWVIPDAKLKGWVDALLSALSFLCWAVILYSFYGYVATLGVPFGFAPYAGPDPCGLAGTGAAFASSLGEYQPLDAENCLALANGALFNAGDNMFTTPENLSLIKRLAWTDVVNAGTWVLIVIILELEIYLQSSRLVGTIWFYAYKSFKFLLYFILIVDAAYWWMLSSPWDAWDALLWIVAFFFIEMNMLSWQEENAKLRAAGEIE
ncbi:MAG TPA: hypothetical protein PLV61_11425 [Parvularculaceae bacterium]|nr:hypothetical protein [Amphiplicatus sp.]HPE31791.1 hypothetical protein [Parvularculaceae bacterium]HRX39838.1 hypothetical protein [Parvularculaceae bacterium]